MDYCQFEFIESEDDRQDYWVSVGNDDFYENMCDDSYCQLYVVDGCLCIWQYVVDVEFGENLFVEVDSLGDEEYEEFCLVFFGLDDDGVVIKFLFDIYW